MKVDTKLVNSKFDANVMQAAVEAKLILILIGWRLSEYPKDNITVNYQDYFTRYRILLPKLPAMKT